MRVVTRALGAIAGPGLLVGLFTGCHAPAPAPPARVINVGYSGEVDFGDVPSLIAHDRLRAKGYRIDVTSYSAPDVLMSALARGSADIGHGSMIGGWTAISRGAPIRTVMSHLANPFRFVVQSWISGCADLTGRRLGLPSESSVSAHLVRTFLREECPGAKPEILFLAESNNRAAAFLSGGVDVGVLELSSLLWVNRQAPGRLRLMSDFSVRWPRIRTTGVHTSLGFARDHPDFLTDYLRALLAANRDVAADPGLLVSAAFARMGGSEDWAATAQAYLAAGVWPPNGGLAAEDVEQTLEFFKTNSRLDPALTRESVADLRFLEAARASLEK